MRHFRRQFLLVTETDRRVVISPDAVGRTDVAVVGAGFELVDEPPGLEWILFLQRRDPPDRRMNVRRAVALQLFVAVNVGFAAPFPDSLELRFDLVAGQVAD